MSVKKTKISFNFLAWKFYSNAQFSQSFRRFVQNSVRPKLRPSETAGTLWKLCVATESHTRKFIQGTLYSVTIPESKILGHLYSNFVKDGYIYEMEWMRQGKKIIENYYKGKLESKRCNL